MKSMAFTVIGNVFVVVYGPKNPTDDEWYEYMNAVIEHGIDKAVQLIVTEGGGPNSAQRKYLNDLLKGRTVQVAVLSNSTAIRGITTALSWFNKGIQAFSPQEMSGALTHLGVPTYQAGVFNLHINQLRRQVVLPQAACG